MSPSKADQLRQMREAQFNDQEKRVPDIDGRRSVRECKVHPFNLEIYGEPDTGLAESLDNFGLQHPIKITPDGLILSGARRHAAAKKLGWELIDVEIPDLDFDDEAAVQKYILLANAYRKQKTSYVQKKEADAYYRLLDEGEVTKDDLRSTARQKGTNLTEGQDGKDADTPLHLSARAAGLHPRAYHRFRYVTEPNGAERDIDEAHEAGDISSAQASALKRHLAEDAEKVRRDKIGLKTADQTIRKRLKRAKVDHSYTDEQKRIRDAQEAALEANKKGKSFLNALARLKADKHTEVLDERHALILANTVAEIVESVREITGHEHEDAAARVEVGRRPQLSAVGD